MTRGDSRKALLRRRELLAGGVKRVPAAAAAGATAGAVVSSGRTAAAAAGPPAALFVSATGSDRHSGRDPDHPLRSVQTAYARLPMTGGTLILAPGRYDVRRGLALRRTKPVWIVSDVRPTKYAATASRTYPGGPAAVIHSSIGASSLVTTLRPAVPHNGYGFRFSNLVFEIAAPTTKTAIDANCVNMGEVDGCIFWAAHTAADDAVAVRVYADNRHGNDGSWWRIHDNVAAGLALALLGNDTGTRYNCNQHVLRENIGLGRNHSRTTARPFIRIVGGNRCVIRDNNIEGYHVGVQFQTCWMCAESGDGGEVVDIFVDLLDSHGNNIAPIGISTPTEFLPGAILVRGDTYTAGNLIVTAGLYNGAATRTYAGARALALANTRNVVLAPGAGRFAVT
jgi:hypothetical protein